jgi:hypothetical protein
MSEAIREFLHDYGASAVGDSLPQPLLPERESDDDDTAPTVLADVECPAAEWMPVTVPEAPAKPGEYPERFIDGSQRMIPALYVIAPNGWRIPMVLAEAGAIAVRSQGRMLERDFVAVERVLGFVADPFPWHQVEAFALAIAAHPQLQLRLTPANRPLENNPFDYEVMHNQARQRIQQEMLNLERLALGADENVPTLVDGKLAGAIHTTAAGKRPLLVGVVKRLKPDFPHDACWRTLLSLRPGQRTPVFKITGVAKDGHEADMPTASWYLKLAGGPRLAPNWGYVRIDVPWVQFEQRKLEFGFINRLSRWLIDARCRTASYARMPVSLEPIVRAEDLLKCLFTELGVLRTRLLAQAGGLKP